MAMSEEELAVKQVLESVLDLMVKKLSNFHASRSIIVGFKETFALKAVRINFIAVSSL